MIHEAGLIAAGEAPFEGGRAVMLALDGAAGWAAFRASPEAADGAPDPLDRWSERVISALAGRLGARAIFPFGGPPYAPFYALALATGRVWPSPVGLLVDAERGLWASYRGALVFEGAPVASPRERPCAACAAPCLTACPVGALSAQGYDVAACAAWLRRPEGADCLQGCLVRRACPAGHAAAPTPDQAGFHMEAFLRARES